MEIAMIRRTMLAAIVAAFAFASLAQAQQQSAPPNMEKVRQACGADIQRLCAGIQSGGGRLMQCMRGHQSELSPECQTALASARSAR